MFPLTVSQLRRLLNLASPDAVLPDDRVLGLTIDSRGILPGHVFVALPGRHAHGAEFAGDALRRGAVAVISDIDRPETVAPHHWLQVPDAVAALQQIGCWNRSQSDALVIGITGSVGKTTTRQMVCQVLEMISAGIQSEANYNNHLGVPLTLCRLRSADAFAVVELAASAAGEIRRLTDISRPDFAIVTTVAEAHLDGFGSLDGVRQAKQELVESITGDGTVFLNVDDSRVIGMRNATAARIITFGCHRDADVCARGVHCRNNLLNFAVGGTEFRLNVPGDRFLTAALAAIAVGREVGMPDHDIAERLAGFCVDAGRGRVLQTREFTLIDDSYNACPASMRAAIRSLNEWQTTGRRVVVLGDMLELGDRGDAAHEDLGILLAESGIDHSLVFGNHAGTVAAAAMRSGLHPGRISAFTDFDTLRTVLDCVVGSGDVILIKGSRGRQLERLLPDLVARGDAGATMPAAA